MSTDNPDGPDASKFPGVPHGFDEKEQDIAARLIDMPIEDELKESYLTYAMSVIVSRALPDVRDGLNPVPMHPGRRRDWNRRQPYEPAFSLGKLPVPSICDRVISTLYQHRVIWPRHPRGRAGLNSLPRKIVENCGSPISRGDFPSRRTLDTVAGGPSRGYAARQE